RLCIPVIFPC
uniref:Riparin-1.1 n=1 Tax=Crinia riparia TaxID=446489 RepID=RIP11_CRIRI|nr:RecName: Full=Riparin-1.1 [Crinia riparia]